MTGQCVGSSSLTARQAPFSCLSAASASILHSPSSTLLPRRIHALSSPARRASSRGRTPLLPGRSFPNPLVAPLPSSRPPPLRASKEGSSAPLSDSTGGEGQQPREGAERSSGGKYPRGALNGASRPGAASEGGGGDAAGSWADGQKKNASGGWGDPSDLDQSRPSAGNQPGLPEFAAGFVLLLGLGALAFAGLHKRVSSAGRASVPKPPDAAVVGTMSPSAAQPSPSLPAPSAAAAAAPASAVNGAEGRGGEGTGAQGAEGQGGGESDSAAKVEETAGAGGIVGAAESRGVDPSLNDLLLPSQIVAAATVAADTPPPLPIPIALPAPSATTTAAAAASSVGAGEQQGQQSEGKESAEAQSSLGEAGAEADGKQQSLEQLLTGSTGEAGTALGAGGGEGGEEEEEGQDVVGPFAEEVAASVSELRPWLDAMQAEQAGEGGETGEKSTEGEGDGGWEAEGVLGEKAGEGGGGDKNPAAAEDGSLSGVPAVASAADAGSGDAPVAPAPASAAAATASDSGADSAATAPAMPWGMTVFVPAPLSSSPPAAAGGGEARAGQVVVRAAVDSTQQTALEALQALEVIEEGVDAAGICSRREFARWLVHASNMLSRAASDRIYPAMYVDGSTALAFDDVTASDPDFPYIQGLAEAGLISSKLSHADLGCPRASAAARRRGCSPGANASFHPDGALTRQDLISWKLSLDYHNMMPLQPKEEVVAAVGFIDAERVDEDALPAIAQDVLRGDRSIIAAAFGFTRRFDPHKPVTRGQAAVALAGGGVSEVVAGEMARVEAEHIAEAAMAVVQEEAAAAAAAEAAMLAAKEEAVAGERMRREEAEMAAEAAVKRVERLQAELESEKEELEQQRQVLAGMREEARRERQEAEAAVEQQRQQVEEQLGAVQQERETAEQALANARAAAAAAAEAAEELRVEKQQLEAKRHLTEEQAQLVQEAAEELQRARLQLQRRLQQQQDIGEGEDASSMGGVVTGTADGGAGDGAQGGVAVEGTDEEKQLLERVAEILARKQAAQREAGGGFGTGWSVDAAVSKAMQLLQQGVERVKAAGQDAPRDPSALAQLLQQQAMSTLEGAKAAIGGALQRGKAAGEASNGGLVSQIRKQFAGRQREHKETGSQEARDATDRETAGDVGSRASKVVVEAVHIGERLAEGATKVVREKTHQAKEVVNQLMGKWSRKGGAGF
ncbi:hypothetical protein CLOM_g16511 [Closterium sp. NIES-68]|nr:hypothetical protein CLOM_g16511 [Closterium sp. NIES-68]GJP70875.1 hypothetical protein CLOP_g1769 [Closterium sp. NIES-67]